MNKIKIVTDSTSDLRPEDIKKFDLEIAPLYVSFPDKTFIDGVDLNTAKLYSLVDQCGVLPKTAARNPEFFVEIFDKYIKEGYDILCILISSEFSSMYQAAKIASQEFDEKRIRVIDSRDRKSVV